VKIEKLPGYRVIKFTHELDKPQVWEFIKAIKNKIPSNAREYNPERKTWTIAIEYMRQFDTLYDEMFRDKNQEELGI
jgi:hypothetical protein